MDTTLLAILACPKCRGNLELRESTEKKGLACEACAVVYPIEEDIPVLLIEEAIPQETWNRAAASSPV